jgi:nitroreductase
LAIVKEFCTFAFGKKYAELAKECSNEANGKNIYYYGAPLVLFVCYDKTACWKHPQTGKPSGETDATIVATHMMLEAASIGLGTVWISYFDEEKARQLLSIPDDFVPVCMLYIGYKADDFTPNPKMSGKRFPLEHTVFYNDFRSKG